ncbi:family 10 glycosylhydrolase [Nakamurella sp. A5-74]|uniref:Family 10 glycosylhydrolase n=1 Tax=Nakamurella sp. A5-74 TaxID=3158264 RepID=A0AAU8DPM7_9ACTN
MSSAIDRRSFLGLAGATVVGGAFAVTIGTLPASAATAGSPVGDPNRPKRQFRAMWISSVVNIDWPSRTGLSIEQQQFEYIGWLDLAERLNLNAVISQVRPTADAFWPSPHEPWSQYLTGTQGADPGYDPLAFQIAEAHARNLEYHAWFNPYRVSMGTDPNTLVPTHPARVHPDWVFPYGGKLYYNPGIPEVRRFVQDAMFDAVRRYDIDGAHFDDYFYPYPSGTTPLPDQDTFRAYGGRFDDIADWRRDNVNKLVSEFHRRVQHAKPWVKFGISPFGIWANSSAEHPDGSATGGTQSYEAIYADTRRWVKEGWVDYLNPQIYWQIGLAVADYAALVPWWADVVDGTDVALYIGQATYKETSKVFGPDELSAHLTFNQAYPQVDGDVFFSAKDVRSDAQGSTSAMVSEHYSRPAIVPVIEHLGGRAPRRPVGLHGRRRAGGVQLEWTSSQENSQSAVATSYAIWRLDGPIRPGDLVDATHLLATVRRSGHDRQSYLDTTADPNSRYRYVVTALDRLWHESSPASLQI